MTDATNAPTAPLDSDAAAEVHFEPLHRNARWGYVLSTVLGFGLPVLPGIGVVLAAWDPPGLTWMMKFGLFVGIAAVLVIGAWRLGLARHARTRFALDEHSLRIRRGVLWRSETVVPRSRVQHTDVNRGPLDRRLGLASLKVFTAGTKLASLGLNGLPDARAVDLRNALIDTDDGIDDDAR